MFRLVSRQIYRTSIKHDYIRSLGSKPYLNDMYNQTLNTLKNKADASNKRRIDKVDNLVGKVLSCVNNVDNNKLEPIKDNTANLYQKFKLFMKDYGYIGLTNYWLTYSTVLTSSYFACKYGVVDYHSWEWLHVYHMENTVIELSKHWLNVDVVVDKRFEDAIASFLISKMTKPVQWAYVYFTTPWLAKIIRNSFAYNAFYKI